LREGRRRARRQSQSTGQLRWCASGGVREDCNARGRKGFAAACFLDRRALVAAESLDGRPHLPLAPQVGRHRRPLARRDRAERCNGRVYFVEVPVFRSGITAQLHIERAASLTRVLPHLPEHPPPDDITAAQRRLVNQLIRTERIRRYVLWSSASTPLSFTDHLRPLAVIYDCSAERSTGERVSRTHECVDPLLMRQAALLVVNGQTLRQRGRNRSANVLPFTSARVSCDAGADAQMETDGRAESGRG
jgi:hypothetical protein